MDVQYFEILNDPHNDKVKKLVANLRDKKGIYFKHSKSKASVKSPIGFEKKNLKIIKFNQKAWLNPNIDINTELRKTSKIDFDKDFFKLMNNSI